MSRLKALIIKKMSAASPVINPESLKAGDTCFLGDMRNARKLLGSLMQVQHGNGSWGLIQEHQNRKNCDDPLGILLTDLAYTSIGERHEEGECHDLMIFGMIKCKQLPPPKGFEEGGSEHGAFEKFDLGLYFSNQGENNFRVYTIPELQLEVARMSFNYLPPEKEGSLGFMHVLLVERMKAWSIIFDCDDGKVLSSLQSIV